MHNHKNRMFALRAKCSNSQPCRIISRSSICWKMATTESRNGNDSKKKKSGSNARLETCSSSKEEEVLCYRD